MRTDVLYFYDSHPKEGTLNQLARDPTRKPLGLTSESEVLTVVRSFHEFYPAIDIWLTSKVMPGLLDESRAIFEHRSASLHGFAIAKRSSHERKICTLWVDPAKRGQGIATDLILEVSDWLETKYPVISVGEERLPEFRRLFERHSFTCTDVVEGLYRRGKREFVFNGWL